MPPLKVLVIDDNEAHASGLAELLEYSGFEAAYATSGYAGMERAQTSEFDAVLLDVHLPDIDGYEVCRRLRRNSDLGRVAVVFHSGSSPVDMPHGADAFLTYPVEMKHIRSVIQGCVARRRGAQGAAFRISALGRLTKAAGALGSR